jgi:hypothetical protein
MKKGSDCDYDKWNISVVIEQTTNNQNNSNDDIMEVHESPVINSCIVVVEDGRDAPAPTC